MTLFAGMTRTKYAILKKMYFGQAKAPGISWVWAKMWVSMSLMTRKSKVNGMLT